MLQTTVYIVIGLNIALIVLALLILARSSGMKSSEILTQLVQLEKGHEKNARVLNDGFAGNREEFAKNAKALREEIANSLAQFNESVLSRLTQTSQLQIAQNEAFIKQIQVLSQSNEQRMDKLRASVDIQLKAIQEDNSQKLEEMRKTVDEKLHATLEKRLGESFKQVSDRLEQVHKGLGEMHTLASGVGDLKRVLTNVKTRGIWGEIHLGNLLEQILTAEQYAQNVATKPGSNDRVEFAIKLPGEEKAGCPVWLPIDAKFPQEDYQRLLDAQDLANPVLAEEAGRAMELRIRQEAKNIADKYISVPHTTEFAILFLPIEGLYAEVLRRPGLCDLLMRQYRIVLSGPTTLAALLNSLQMGFRTLAIEKRGSEVWSLLGAVKTEFGKFGDLLDKTSKKLSEAGNSIDTAARKSRTIERKLRAVEQLPAAEAVRLLEDLSDVAVIPGDEEEEINLDRSGKTHG
ncbi:MAG: RmuC-domain protein [Firmicutes bacterium]|nr:RmuC-domain protein [Bacillota bacterium]